MKRLACILGLIGATAAAADDAALVARMLKYRELTRITETKVDIAAEAAPLCMDPTMRFGPHIKPGIHVYANELALGKVRTGAARYPVGALLVKEKFEQKQDKKPGIITVMEKVANTGAVDDWQFHMIRLSDRSIVREGLKRSCVSCHTHYKNSDFVTSDTQRLLEQFVAKK